jgi:hypothetical protein
MVSSILDAYISQLDMKNVRNDSKDLEVAYAQRQELHIWVLMVQSTFQCTHSILRLGTLRPYLIAYFEIESNIF